MEKYLIVPANVGSFLTILLGFTTGMLALVGLIAIFISLISQQNFHKCRELYWKIVSNSINNEFRDFYQNFSLYKSIYNESPNEKIIFQIIRTTRYAIWIVVLIWTSLTIYLITIFYLGEYLIIASGLILSVYVLLRFSQYLSNLNNIIAESSLPIPEDFLDSRKIMETKINTYGALLSTLEVIVNYQDSGMKMDLTTEEKLLFKKEFLTFQIIEIYLSFPYRLSYLDIRLLTVDALGKSVTSRVYTEENIAIDESKLVNYKIFSSSNNHMYKICSFKEVPELYSIDDSSNDLEIKFVFTIDEKLSSKYFVTSNFDTNSRYGNHIDYKPEIDSQYVSRGLLDSTDSKKIYL